MAHRAAAPNFIMHVSMPVELVVALPSTVLPQSTRAIEKLSSSNFRDFMCSALSTQRQLQS